MAQGTRGGQAVVATAPPNGAATNASPQGASGVNRKKQKRRAKQAARQAAEQQKLGANATNGHIPHPQSPVTGADTMPHTDRPESHNHPEGDDLYYTDEENHAYDDYNPTNGGANGHYPPPEGGNTGPGKKSKKKKKSKASSHTNQYNDPNENALSVQPPTSPHVSLPPPPPPPPTSSAAMHQNQRTGNSKDRIWNTSTQEERERIKEFWLSLGEDERKSLVKIEKEAVLRKMKEQQKHSCSCTVCGRKRTAIEEELEVLYDAYYEELEQYANHQQPAEHGAPILPPPRRIGHPFSRVPPDRLPPHLNSPPPSRHRIQELVEDDDEDEDEEEGEDEDYSDDDEDYSDEEPEELPRGPAADFFNFGNSLTVKGGILTVADDLLKNDGKKFIEMMEQLAERRMQREEEAQYSAAGLAHPMQNPHAPHNHGPPPEDDDYDDEEEDDYDSNDDYDEEEDDMDSMTEEQRMEEGRRMFQIFAARMFEQRVLTAYREKVARERQQRLLEELEEESRLDVQREAKKARDAQKKKDKKALQKQVKAEEKARKEAEKAAEEAAVRAAEEKRLEEQRKKKDEQRKKKEAERKAQEEERQKREAERQKRLQEERERQHETERKIREQKAQEKKAREEAKKKEREEREAREKEIREKKALQDKERREREAKQKVEKDTKERTRKEDQGTNFPQAPTIMKRPQQVPVALPPGLVHSKSSTGIPSPHVQIATPALPKAPTPGRPRQSSAQGSHGSSPRNTTVVPGSKAMSPMTAISQLHSQIPATLKTVLNKGSNQSVSSSQHATPQSPSPMAPIGLPPGMHPPPTSGFGGFPPGLNGFPQSQGPVLPNIMPRPIGQNIPMFPQQPPLIGSQFRPFAPAPGLPGPPPGLNGPPLIPHGRGFPLDPPPGFTQQMPGLGASNVPPFGRDPLPTSLPPSMPTSHSRQQSGSFEAPLVAPQAQPIARPAPIQRPSSVKPHELGQENKKPLRTDIDDLSSHLGSSALLGDEDEPIPEIPGTEPEPRRASLQTGLPRSIRLGFGHSSMYPEGPPQPRIDSFSLTGSGLGGSSGPGSAWSTPTMPFGPMSAGTGGWGSSPTTNLFNNNAFGVMGNQHRPSISRPVSVRRMVCQACRELNSAAATGAVDGFHDAQSILRQVESIRPTAEAAVQLNELLDICETEGDTVNGGGTFHVKRDGPNRTLIKFEEGGTMSAGGRNNSVLGEIGSPLPGHSLPASFGTARTFSSLGAGGVQSPNF